MKSSVISFVVLAAFLIFAFGKIDAQVNTPAPPPQIDIVMPTTIPFPDLPSVERAACGADAAYFVIRFQDVEFRDNPSNLRTSNLYYSGARIWVEGGQIVGAFPLPTEPSAAGLLGGIAADIVLFAADNRVIDAIELAGDIGARLFEYFRSNREANLRAAGMYVAGVGNQSILFGVHHTGRVRIDIETMWMEQAEDGGLPPYEQIYVVQSESVTLCDGSQSDSATGQSAASSNAGVADATVQAVTANDQWTPVVQDFDGVPMVQVPPGCFMMGSTDEQVAVHVAAGVDPDWFADEQPVHEQCFEEPFWIDQTEVTQAQFAALGGQAASPSYFSGDNRPVERITWFEARDFCALRGARLPTEAEWEYAARGPDGLVYPWGNDWDENNAVWDGNSNGQTANVGSIPAGRAWVGAFDLSGNVWEWMSSLYLPYDSTEEREADTGNRTDVRRVLRGGSWDDYDSVFLRAGVRYRYFPDGGSGSFGFRCARSF